MVSNDIRRLLTQRAQSRRTRTTVFTAARPTHWAPQEVTCPTSGEPFTPEGAWAFVVEKLAGGEPIDTVELEKPPGATGYVMICDGTGGQKIYIKLQLGSDQVIGRSFHLSK